MFKYFYMSEDLLLFLWWFFFLLIVFEKRLGSFCLYVSILRGKKIVVIIIPEINPIYYICRVIWVVFFFNPQLFLRILLSIFYCLKQICKGRNLLYLVIGLKFLTFFLYSIEKGGILWSIICKNQNSLPTLIHIFS